MLDLPPNIIDKIFLSISELGWDDSWASDDNLSSKRLAVGTNFKLARCPIGIGKVMSFQFRPGGDLWRVNRFAVAIGASLFN